MLSSCIVVSIAFLSTSAVIQVDDSLKEFINPLINEYLRLLNRCILIVLEGCDSYELGHPILINYLENILPIEGLDRVVIYKARLSSLDKKFQALNNLSQASTTALTVIEVARSRNELLSFDEEL